MRLSRLQWLRPPSAGFIYAQVPSMLPLAHPPPSSVRLLSSSSCRHATAQAQRRRHRDPYALAQAKQRAAANSARRATLMQQREAALGDPVWNRKTDFFHHFDDMLRQSKAYSRRIEQKADDGFEAGQQVIEAATLKKPKGSVPGTSPQTEAVLNYSVQPEELKATLERSRFLTEPSLAVDQLSHDPAFASHLEVHESRHANATVAMARILNLTNASRIDVRRLTRRHCVETFGRHRTDEHLPPKPAAAPLLARRTDVTQSPSSSAAPTKTPRAGPDTGSPEVQIALLTCRIRSLAAHLNKGGRTDKVNKRNLTLLVHKRQKLLQYLRRQDRGASRWQWVMNTLGLTDRMWQGEISLS
ncbi:MAG: structural constituent of ribosome [Watsoniomyces obsoletus]|nr:MAG: structural constituent of ribosome [Watsoniomyces obsoletus]